MKAIRFFFVFVFLQCVFLFNGVVNAIDLETKNEIVKVGFFQFPGFHQIDENGVYSGYGYEFLQKISLYNNWSYGYVGYKKSWSDMQSMLENGQIDILTSAQKTPERELKYDFSEKPIGISSTIICAKSGDRRFIPGFYKTYEGMRVGMIEGNSRNKVFDEFAKQHHFTYKAVYFDSLPVMEKSLQLGDKIDTIVTSNLRNISKEWVLDEFGASPFYAIVKKGNKRLLDNINRSIDHLERSDPNWKDSLFNKYYSPSSVEEIAFSANELRFLSFLKRNNSTFTVGVSPDRPPFSYFDDKGNPHGIMVEAFELIAKRVGLRYRIEPSSSRSAYTDKVKKGYFDILIDAPYDYSFMESRGYKICRPYLKATISSITKLGNDPNKNIGFLANTDLFRMFGNQILKNGESFYYYKNLNDGFVALKKGLIGRMFTYSYTAQKLVSEDLTNKYTLTIQPDLTMQYSIGVSKYTDYHLGSVLDKATDISSSRDIQRIILAYTTRIKTDTSIWLFLYEHPFILTLISIFILSLIFVIIYLRYHTKNTEILNLQEINLSRFMGYVCRSNDSVSDIDIANMTVRECAVTEKGAFVHPPKPYKLILEEPGFIYSEDREKVNSFVCKESLFKMMSDPQGMLYFECRCKDSDGEYRWYSYTLQTIPVDKNHPCSIIVFRKNIDAIKREEEQNKSALKDALIAAKQASEAKGSFLSRVSHEIRTPLNAIIGYTSLARQDDTNVEKVQHYLKNSELAAHHLLNIINDVLDVSSIESGRMKIASESFDLKKMLSTISTIYYCQAKNKKIKFDLVLNKLNDEFVVGDQLRVNQVLMNLLSNSLKFTPEDGEIKLRVTQLDSKDKGTTIKFEVSDTGIGISKEFMSKMFTPFEQESAMTAQKYGGTGLGLSISKNLVNMMGGSIEVQSEQGKGSTFTVILNFGYSKQNENVIIQKDFAKVRALVIDNEDQNGSYIKDMLKRCGVKCDVLMDCKKALTKLEIRNQTENPYNLCIIDVDMDNDNTIELVVDIKHKITPNTPIIIATAYDVSQFEDQSSSVGVDKVISKPLFQSTVFDLLVEKFGKYEPQVEAKDRIYDLKGSRILLAEDNLMNQEIAVEILSKSGILIDTAVNGKDAVEKFNQSKPGTYIAILMDIQMPIMDGYQATKAIRSGSHPEATTIPIIATTANAFNEDVSKALACGMSDHISKPIDYKKLFRALTTLANKNNAMRLL